MTSHPVGQEGHCFLVVCIQKLPNFVIAHAEQMAKICTLHFRSSYLVQINVESEIFTVGHIHLTSHVEVQKVEIKCSNSWISNTSFNSIELLFTPETHRNR